MGIERRSSRTLMLFVLDHKVFTYVMTALTIHALFGDDLRLLFFTKSADWLFNLLTSISMLAFVFEIEILINQFLLLPRLRSTSSASTSGSMSSPPFHSSLTSAGCGTKSQALTTSRPPSSASS